MNPDVTQVPGRLLIVSNRLPVTVQRQKDGVHYQPSVGGLATSLQALELEGEMLWLGWPGFHPKSDAEAEAVEAHLREAYGCVALFLSPQQIDHYYNGFSNGCIWPLFHYFSQYVRYEPAQWQAYQAVNRCFRDKIMEILEPNDRVWVQDYHLMLLPSLLREASPELSVGFFLHIPFPSSEIYRILPWRQEILEGLVGADVVGFHTFGYSRHFLSSVLRILGLKNAFGQIQVRGRTVVVDTFPLGIDVERFASALDAPEGQAELADLQEKTRDRKIILSVDRLDFTKGIPQRLLAFERFLEQHPRWREKVTLIALCVPSRERVPQYQSLKREVDELVGRINGRFGKPGWSPIWYLYRSLAFESLVALYRLADVALVTPIRDGMNLVTKEYLASRPDRTGVLIISETAGAAEELSEALIVNPNDQQAIIHALGRALDMKVEEQRLRNEPMIDHLRRYDTQRWAREFLGALDAAGQRRPSLQQEKLEGERRQRLLNHYRGSQRRLLLLDYDGTLMPFARRPGGAAPDEALLSLLGRLNEVPANTVVIISGRGRDTLDAWLGSTGVDLAAEHGARLRRAGAEWEKVDASLTDDWKDQIRPVLQTYVDRTAGALLEEKEEALVWHYRNTDPELGSMRAKELIDHLESLVANTSLHLLHGNRVVEVKNINVNKGKAAHRWLEAQPGYTFVLGIGDDVTDEDLFDALPEDGWSVRVGRLRSSGAREYVNNPDEVRRLLEELAQIDVA